MAIKINAAARLKAGWWNNLSNVAKKAYKNLHPNSKMGDATSSDSGGTSDALNKAKEDHKKHMKNYDKHRDAMHDGSTEAEWDAHDRALSRLEKSRDKIARLK